MPHDAESRREQSGADARPRPEDHHGPDPASTPPERRSGTGSGASWQRTGGGLLVVAAILQLGATWLEHVVLGAGVSVPVFVVFVAVSSASALLLGAAGFALARLGIVGTSATGRFALRAAGLCWIGGRAAYLAYTYFLPPSTANSWFVVLSTVLLWLTIAFALVAAIDIAARRIAWGPARGSLLLALGVAVVVGLAVPASGSALAVTLLESVSALGQVFVGVTYVVAAGRDPWIGG